MLLVIFQFLEYGLFRTTDPVLHTALDFIDAAHDLIGIALKALHLLTEFCVVDFQGMVEVQGVFAHAIEARFQFTLKAFTFIVQFLSGR